MILRPGVTACFATLLLGSSAFACATDSNDDVGDDLADAATTGQAAPRECPVPEGRRVVPDSIEGVVSWLQALPAPVSLPCFLESLPRPLQLSATTNAFSAQPAEGNGNPRLFITSGPLTMAVVPVGIGRQLLEMAVDIGNRESLKAELSFPLAESPTEADPYLHIQQAGGGSTCNGCHGGERLSDTVTVTDAFVSEALQPPPDLVVSVAFVQQLATGCDTAVEPERCAMLAAIFDHGEIVAHPFPADNRICRSPE